MGKTEQGVSGWESSARAALRDVSMARGGRVRAPVAHLAEHGVTGIPDMVTSHVETLIERLTGAEKVKVDPDGDYPIRLFENGTLPRPNDPTSQ